MVKGLIYNGKNPETILKWLGSSGEESCEFGSSAMFYPYLSAEDCDCNSKGRYWSIQLDADATDVRRSLPVSQAHAIPGTFTWPCIARVSTLTLSFWYLKTAPCHLFDDDTLALLSSHFFCLTLRALDSHIASSIIPLLLLYKYPVITLVVHSYKCLLRERTDECDFKTRV